MATVKYLDSQGLKYYDSLVKAEIDKKQNIITDLDEIRANAKAQNGAIDTIKVDNTPLTITNKTVNIDLTGKADKGTTLSNYGILDAYTKTETESVINVAIGKIVNEDNNDKIDTLKEIASWITDDVTGAAKIISDVSSLKSSKQDTISDIDTIRSNAKAGAEFADSHANDQANVIEVIKVNGQQLTITDKTVNIDIASASSEFTTDQMAAINSGITEAKVTVYDRYSSMIDARVKTADLSPITDTEIYDLIYPSSTNSSQSNE